MEHTEITDGCDYVDQFEQSVSNQHSVATRKNCGNVCIHWVSADSFSAWLDHLMAGSGYSAEEIAVACHLSPAVAWALAGRHPAAQRIRYCHASQLLAMDVRTLTWPGARKGEAADQALPE